MKVIGTDNWGRDYNGGRSEIVAGENLSQEAAEDLARVLNASRAMSVWYVVKPDDYVPYKFEGY
jgi:hypothetical protein